MMSGTEFISLDRTRNNISISSTHLDYKAPKIVVTDDDISTPIQLPDHFWSLYIFDKGPEHKVCWNESNFQNALFTLVDNVHRGLRQIQWILQEDCLTFNTEIA